jgi:hypothetical protein
MVELSNGQSVDLTVAYTDAQGAAAHPPGVVTWWSSDDSVAKVSAGTDDTQATVTSVAGGTATITAESNGISCGIDMVVAQAPEGTVEGQITAGEPYPSEGGREPAEPVQPLPGGQGGAPGWLPGQRPGQQAPVRPGQTVVRTTTIRR